MWIRTPHSRLAAAAVGVLLFSSSGCAIATAGGPRAVPEVISMLQFAAYPKATLISEEGSTTTLAFASVPGRYGTRIYETADDRAAVRAYYERLARDNQWTFTAPEDGLPDVDTSYGNLAELRRDRFSILVGPTYDGTPAAGKFRFRVDVSVSSP